MVKQNLKPFISSMNQRRQLKQQPRKKKKNFIHVKIKTNYSHLRANAAGLQLDENFSYRDKNI